MNWSERKHTHLWNDLPDEERHRLMPYMMEAKILHIEQTMAKAIDNHNQFLRDCQSQINNIKQSMASL